MSALTANRHRALSTVCRAQPSRMVHSSSVNQATALSSSALLGQEPQEITLQPIFDIFDAPTRLADSRQFIREKYSSQPQKVEATHAQAVSFDGPKARPVPAPLPAPIIFDGPARPQNPSLAFQSRLRQSGLAPSPPQMLRPSSTATRSFSSSEPLVQMFDGPARITRYHHQSSSDNSSQNSKKIITALGVAGAVGGAVLLQDNEEARR
ncbi:hypothetical protein CVT24_009162 [Panaeolus cyanescens]|uniref:Uncharacterized protein n=1 Tax=Panaeolus cyanescens TaxID=181874 RepID=A0A409Y8N1_9AGAR|nr:hypothetical protein CVT24_009162 [Panaeolus cyanescens]